MSYETRYAARKRAEFGRRAESPEAVEWRKRDAAVRAQALTEWSERWPHITAENARESVAWLEARITELHDGARLLGRERER